MNSNRLTFFDPTNIKVPITIFRTLVHDAFHFNYVKNGEANLSGFLNYLIPTMSNYRKNLHSQFLKQTNNDEDTTRKIEECIYKIYFNQYDFCDDSTATIPFRINNIYYEKFLKIHDLVLEKYNMDFTKYIRSLLLEYSSKRLAQREYFYFFNSITQLKEATARSNPCNFYTHEDRISFIPISLEIAKNSKTYIVGITENKEELFILPLCMIKSFTVEETKKILITDEDAESVYDYFKEYEESLEKEDTVCLE